MEHSPPKENRPVREVVAGTTTFAAAALILVSALLTALQGISALGADELLVVDDGDTDYVYAFNTTVWGSILIIVGALLAAVAFGLFWGKTWAQASAIVMASLSIVAMFLWLPYYPVWAVVVIALDIIVIWAIATWRPAL